MSSLFDEIVRCGLTLVCADPDFFAGITCVNVRMLEGVDLKALKMKFADGKSYTPA